MDSIRRICATGTGTVASAVTLVTSAITTQANTFRCMEITNCSSGVALLVKIDSSYSSGPTITTSNFFYRIPANDWLELNITESMAVWIRSESSVSVPYTWRQVQ